MNNKQKNKKNRQLGFTLAEVLVVIGMISILLSIGGLSVVQYQKVLKLSELDTTARELFVVAQNQIIKAKASGEWGQIGKSDTNSQGIDLGQSMAQKPSDYPEDVTWPEGGKGSGHDYRYIVYNKATQTLDSTEEPTSETILETILPYGVIDEHIRAEGQYIIEYDYQTGNVYGVFYTESNHIMDYDTDIMGASGLDANKGRESSKEGRATRKNYKTADGPMMIGYYGGGTGITVDSVDSETLGSLKIEVANGDKLEVKIINENNGTRIEGKEIQTKISLTVTGEESGKSENKLLEIHDIYTNSTDTTWVKKTVEGNKTTYTVTLDSMDKEGIHFADLFPKLIPGENIIVTAEAFSEDVLCTPVKVQAYTNSLFELKENGEENIGESSEENNHTGATAIISNVRHLQNLSSSISNIPVEDTTMQNIGVEEDVTKVGQIITKVKQVGDIGKEGEKVDFYSIDNTTLKEYEGNGLTIRNLNLKPNESLTSNLDLTTNENGNVGVFAQIGTQNTSQELTIKNLKLEGMVSEAQKEGASAGTLIGEVKKGKLIAQNVYSINPTVKAASGGYAGGLVGKMGEGSLTQCGVYLTSDADGSAAEKYESGAYMVGTDTQGDQFVITTQKGVSGGLVGKIEKNTTINNSFAAVPVKDRENGIAGGLVGKISENIQVSITNSYTSGYTKDGKYTDYYSIAAVGSNGTAGGFIGQDNNQNTIINDSYSTASVYGNTVGGFIGTSASTTVNYENCYVTGKVIDTASIKDPFIGKLSNPYLQFTEKNCYYLEQSNPDLKTSQIGVSGVAYDELAQPTDSSKGITTYYDANRVNTEYPFRTVIEVESQQDVVHYGDWPEKEESLGGVFGDVGVLYYEIIDDKLYYHGYFGEFSSNESNPNYQEVMTEGEGLVNGLVTDINKFVSEDGYLILVPKGKARETMLVTVGASKTGHWPRWTLDNCTEPFNRKDLLPIEGYDAYYFSKGNEQDHMTYYITIGNKPDPYQLIFGDYVSFGFSDYFADSVKIKNIEEKKFYIRSTRHLLNMAKLGWSHTQQADVEYVQTLDISYEDVEFTENGKKTAYDYKSTTRIVADYRVEEYKGGERNYGYMIKGLDEPLFIDIVSNSTIKGVNLVNSNVNTPADIGSFTLNNGIWEFKKTNTQEKNVGSLALYNYGVIENCSVHNAIMGENNDNDINTEEIDKVAGFVYYNNGGMIKNSSFKGKVKGRDVSGFVYTNESGGKIENCSVDAVNSDNNLENSIGVEGTNQAVGFVETNRGTIKGSSFKGKVKGKDVSGFVYTNESGGKIENCSVDAVNSDNNLENSIGVGGTNQAVGFVETNRGTIENSSFKGKVKGKYASGFIITNGGTIKNSYSYAVVEGAMDGMIIDSSNIIISSSGFALTNGGTMDNAYFVGTVKGQIVAGFVGTNTGTIKSCKVRTQVPGEDGYSSIVVEGIDQAAGFVHTNKGSIGIENSYDYFVGTVKANKVGGFVYTNQGTIENSYTNVNLTGTESASGFVHEHSGGTIRNSFVTGWVRSIGSNSTAYGFMQKSGWVTMENCYTALFELSGSKIYYFGKGPEYNNNYKDCFWLDDTLIQGEVQIEMDSDPVLNCRLKPVGEKKSYEEMTQTDEANRPTTYSYSKSLEGKKYPFTWFSTGDSSMEFWGDWPLKRKDLVGVLYYEIIQDKLYYHGYTKNFSNNGPEDDYVELMTKEAKLLNGLTTASNQYVSEDGYIILVRKGKSLEQMGITFSNKTKKLSECVESFTSKDLFDLKEFDVYYFKEEMPINGLTTIKITKDINIDNPQEEDFVTFAFNPYFSDTVRKTAGNENEWQIRSARQLLNMSKQANQSTDNLQYVQTLDISYMDTPFTQNGNPQNYDYTVVKNMNSRYKALEAQDVERSYVIKGLRTPLFETIESQVTIEGVTLINSRIEAIGNIAGFANINKGNIKNCSFEGSVKGEIASGFVETNAGVIESCYVRAQIQDNKGYSAVKVDGSNQAVGFVNYNNEGSTIKDSYFVGTVIGGEAIGFTNINKGTITSCYANVDLQATTIGTGFLNSNWSAVENCFSVGWVKSNESAFGFIHRDETQSVLKDSYAALFKLEGTKTCGFGTGKGSSYKDCFYLESAVNPKTEQKGSLNGLKVQGTGKTYDEMSSISSIGNKPQTFPYSDSLKGQLYPFKIISTDSTLISLEFWGDWPNQ